MAKMTALFVLAFLAFSQNSFSLAASWVDFEYRDENIFRVKVVYTVPELKEVREVWVDFADKKKAEAYYFDLAKGADFYFPNAKDRGFAQKVKTSPNPW